MKFYEPIISMEVYNEKEDLTYRYRAEFVQVVPNNSTSCDVMYHITVMTEGDTIDTSSLFPFQDKIVQLTSDEYEELVDEPVLLIPILEDGKFPPGW